MTPGTWVDCRGTSSYFNGFAADMGPYTGPWPLMSPGLFDAEGGECDFYVLLPHPAHPGNPAYAGDGSYSTDVFNAYRFSDDTPSGSSEGYFRDHVGDGSAGAALPSGAHLYVVIWYATVAPRRPSAYYVPRTYASLGRSTAQTFPGGWSASQPGLTDTDTANPTAQTGWTVTSSQQGANGAYSSVTPFAEAALNALLTAAVAKSAGVSGSTFIVSAQKTLFAFTRNTTVEIDAQQSTAVFQANPSLPSPGGEVPDGAEVGANPDPATDFDPYQFDDEDPAAGGFAWGQLNVTAGGNWLQAPSGAAASIPTPTHSFRVSLLSGPVIPGTAGLIAGEEIGSIAVSAADGGVLTTHALDLPTGLPQQIVLGIGAEMLYSGVDSSAVPDFADDIGAYGWDAGRNSFAAIEYTWTTSRWRFWLPNIVAPATPLGEPYLRMTQRDDGLGIGRHPRLAGGPNGASSRQRARSPRVGTSNTYR